MEMKESGDVSGSCESTERGRLGGGQQSLLDSDHLELTFRATG